MRIKQQSSSRLEPIHPKAAGIDIGSQTHWVCVPADHDSNNVRSFGCFTTELAGVSRLVKLVNAHHVKSLPGRKTDVLDCQWLQQLHSYGLLAGSFRPADQVCVLRSYIRQRDNLIKSACVHIQRMQKALTQMNVQLHQVVSALTGTTGMAIIRAIVAGEHNPQTLAALRHHLVIWLRQVTGAPVSCSPFESTQRNETSNSSVWKFFGSETIWEPVVAGAPIV